MPRANRITTYLAPTDQFTRSIHIERDYGDSCALDRYVVTETARQLATRLSAAFRDDSTERAWRLTGDYGTGKSCFALALARACDPKHADLPSSLGPIEKSLAHATAFPILATGTYEPLSTTIIRGVTSAFQRARTRAKPRQLRDVPDVLDANPAARDRFAIDLLHQSAAVVRKKSGGGILLVVDELGRSLDYAIRNPDDQEITFLQSLAEAAARSSSSPIVLLGILHQGFSAYADGMEGSTQREWDKIGGRFAELLFDQPLEQLVELVAHALGVKIRRLPDTVVRRARRNMKDAIRLGWYGVVSDESALIAKAPAVFPLQPMLIPVLLRFFRRFGQNERSLFSFLCSSDPSALRSFAAQHRVTDGFFGIHHLYDYARTNIGHCLNTRALSSRWSQIESVIDASLATDPQVAAILKTAGILNMLDDPRFAATGDALKAAVNDACTSGRASFADSLESLTTDGRVLYSRGQSGGYCLWPHTSVNLELKYADAERAVKSVHDPTDAIAEFLSDRPIVARRHYVETGNLRYFDIVYVKASEIRQAVDDIAESEADGVVIIPLCRTKSQRDRVRSTIGELSLKTRPYVLVAIPVPLGGLSGLVTQIRRWEWIRANVDELVGDTHAREEVSRQLAAAKSVLLDRTKDIVDVRSFRASEDMEWYHKGARIKLGSSRELSRYLSKVCDDVYSESPILQNELLNRRKLSSAAAAARMRLIERIFDSHDEEFLGMDAARKPPEMSMYLSAIHHSNLHVPGPRRSRIAIPSRRDDTCRLRPLFDCIRRTLTVNEGDRVPVSNVFAELRKPPIGARDGVLPLMLAVFCVAESQHVALYEDDAFVHDVGGAEFARLVKVPESFELQYYKLSGIRFEVFSHLLGVVGVARADADEADLINVVQPLCQFAASLQEFARSTGQLGKRALAVREALLDAREPAKLVFEDLPVACGVPRIPKRRRGDIEAKKYAHRLKRALGELRSAYPDLLSRIEARVAGAFSMGQRHAELREALRSRSAELALHVTDPSLKAFCLRLSDTHLNRDAWLESIGSLVVAKPPRRWHDRDETAFEAALRQLVTRFQHTASLRFPKGGSATPASVRIAILEATGEEHSCVVDEPVGATAAGVRKKIEQLFRENPQAALAAASHAILQQLSVDDTGDGGL